MAQEESFAEVFNISPSESERAGYIAIVGGGLMGRGIAQTAASAGINVLIIERDDDTSEKCKERLSEMLDAEIERWALTKGEKRAILARTKLSTELTEVSECDVVIEAIDEDFTSKKAIFKQLDKICDPNTIFVSNTATLSLTKLAEATSRPDKIIGMHFLNPVPRIPLVEVIRALKTSDETFRRIKQFAEDLGKTVVEVYEYPGFVTTRVILPMLNEAMQVFLEGIATAEGIDTAIKLGYGLNVGPLEMADSMGLDEVLTWLDTLYHELGAPQYRASPILRRKVREGKLGKKTGEGFFRYDESGKKMENYQ
ncbi:MAG: 3-hydroxyacyl-CoA dehydrogenase NAD-binding domain-containing protein [Bacteroidetes bacterium]|nr:3-hydroxyacyl-CoA dehydrogenase NAD-binding domain-containing protein [Bacteroidota bacterium]MCL5738280.1 3-hydroxyacyl-CoA dehydrogenase NAD-binding domain-containing protein [Bacteroidota bacterium]